MERIRTSYGLLSLSTLAAGMAIYLLFRDISTIVLFAWIPKPGFLETVLVPLPPSALTNFVKYHLPDTLWFVSAILLLRCIWFYRLKTQTVYIVCCYGMGLAIEASQLSEKVPGTFDRLDLLCMGIGAFIEGLLHKIVAGRRFA